MFSVWINCLKYGTSEKEVIRKLLFSPVDTLKLEDLQKLSTLCTKYHIENKEVFINSFLLLFLENNIEQLARRVDLLPCLAAKVSSCRIRVEYLPVMIRFSSGLTTVMKKSLNALKEKLMEPVDEINSRTLFDQWKTFLSTVAFYFDEDQMSDSSYPAFWQQWQKELAECKDELVAMAHNSEMLKKDEYWKELDRFYGHVSTLFPRLSKSSMQQPPDNPVTSTLQLILHSDQKRFITRWHQQMSEKELVIIATRVAPDVADHIIHNTHRLSLEALAEIGRHHPHLIMPLVERGDFQDASAVPDLVRFASAFEPLAEAVHERKYNQHLPLSWQGKLVADFPELSERLWTEFCQKHSGSDTPVSDEWSQALAHICQHETIARKILQHPGTAKNKLLLTAIGCHHKSLVDKGLIDTLSKNHLFGLVMIIRTHGIAPFETMLDSKHKDIFKYQVDDDCLWHSSEKDLDFRAAMAWRDKAETIVDGPLWQSQYDFDKTLFLKHWPYLKERFPPSRHFNLDQALKLLKTPLKWSELDSKAIINICQFPTVAEKICFEHSLKALADKLTEEEKFAIYSKFENTSHLALALKSLDNDQVCTLLGKYPDLQGGHRNKLLKCTKEQIAKVYSQAEQSDNATELLKGEGTSFTDIRDKLEGDEWFKIAWNHKNLALLLFRDEHKTIRELLTNDQLHELALKYQEILKITLDEKVSEDDILAWSAQQWITLFERHPEYFGVIYEKMKHVGRKYRRAVSKEALVEFQDQPALWHQILSCVTEQDRQWLSDHSGLLLPATGYARKPAKKYDADSRTFIASITRSYPLKCHKKGAAQGIHGILFAMPERAKSLQLMLENDLIPGSNLIQ